MPCIFLLGVFGDHFTFLQPESKRQLLILSYRQMISRTKVTYNLSQRKSKPALIFLPAFCPTPLPHPWIFLTRLCFTGSCCLSSVLESPPEWGCHFSLFDRIKSTATEGTCERCLIIAYDANKICSRCFQIHPSIQGLEPISSHAISKSLKIALATSRRLYSDATEHHWCCHGRRFGNFQDIHLLSVLKSEFQPWWNIPWT